MSHATQHIGKTDDTPAATTGHWLRAARAGLRADAVEYKPRSTSSADYRTGRRTEAARGYTAQQSKFPAHGPVMGSGVQEKRKRRRGRRGQGPHRQAQRAARRAERAAVYVDDKQQLYCVQVTGPGAHSAAYAY